MVTSAGCHLVRCVVGWLLVVLPQVAGSAGDVAKCCTECVRNYWSDHEGHSIETVAINNLRLKGLGM